MKAFSKKSKHIFSRTVFYFFLPSVITIAAIILSVSMNYMMCKNNIADYAQAYIKQFMNESEQKIESAVNAAGLLAANSEIVPLLQDESLSPSAPANAAIRQLMQTYSCIDSVFIYSPSSHLLINHNNDIYTNEEFFSKLYSYDIYNTAYWESLRFYNSAAYKVLLPTEVSTDGSKKGILPIVIRSSGDFEFNNYMVVNLNLRYLILSSTISKISDNSEVYIFNRYNYGIFNSSMNLLESKYPEDFYDMLMTKNSDTFDYRIDSKKSMINYFSNTMSLNGYTYFVVTPYRDIWMRILPTLLLNIVIGIMFILLSFFLAFTNMNNTLTPLKDLFTSITQKRPDPKKNVITELRASAMQLYEENVHLKETLPVAQSKYLIDFLNNTDYLIDSETKELIKSSLPFSHDWYAVVIIGISFRNIIYDSYTQTECSRIKYGLYDLIKELFLDRIDSCMLVGEKDELYIITNSETNTRNADIDEIIEQIKESIAFDADALILSVGKSMFYKDMAGLKKAHEEAMISLNIIDFDRDTHIITHLNPKRGNINYTLNDVDETKLFNALIAYKTDLAISIVNDIADRNKSIDARSKQQLYQNILTIILKVIRLKNIPFKNDKMDFEIYNLILNLSPDETHKKIISILEYIKKYADENIAEDDVITSVIKYIDKSYTDSLLSLESVASMFNISVSGLSFMIKNKIGIGFYQYVTSLRLEKSKKLLLETAKPISEISEECGFGSVKTFYRIFKKNVGMTSMEFRTSKGGTASS